jgi:hypothetical protein
VRRIASISLLFILAFNWLGYRLLTGYLEHNSDISLEKKIEKSEYNDADLIELRVPLNAPYLSSNPTEFERFDGEVELQGRHYKYVKRKIEDGQLVLLCLPDENKSRIQNSREEFFKLVNDLGHNSQSKSKNTSSFKSFTTEYKKENNSWEIAAIAVVQPTFRNVAASSVAEGFHTIPKQPPRA